MMIDKYTFSLIFNPVTTPSIGNSVDTTYFGKGMSWFKHKYVLQSLQFLLFTVIQSCSIVQLCYGKIIVITLTEKYFSWQKAEEY